MALENASRETRLQWFARQVIDQMWQGGDVDGGDIQGWALKAGLIKPEVATAENIENVCFSECIEIGDTFYKFSPDLQDVKWHEMSPDQLAATKTA